MIHLGDITKIKGDDVPSVDCVTGGSPCQELSVAGKRAGLHGARSSLFMEQIRVIKEMRKADEDRGRTNYNARPRFMVWENVPGVFSSNGGEDFAKVLHETVKIACPEAPAVPVPAKGWPNAGCLRDLGGRWSIAWRVHDAQFWGVPQRRKRIALVADFGGNAAAEILFERKGLRWDSEPSTKTREETAGSFGGSADKTRRTYINRQIPSSFDSLASNSMKSSNPYSGCREVSVAKTLDTGVPDPSRNQGGIAIFDARGNGNGNIVSTLTGDHQNRITDYTALCIGNGQTNQISMAEKANALDTMHDQQAVYVPSAATVRRLTPLECERLQGYPDGWTDIGAWTDSKGRSRHTSDTVRYKALGNSIALPFWFWLLRRISAQYERPATLGSLFDGIGGFPLCWERSNGKGTALWASEIDEFCIAVTKRRFKNENQD